MRRTVLLMGAEEREGLQRRLLNRNQMAGVAAL